MEAFIQALKAYQDFNPSGWVGIYRLLPMWGGIVLCALGLIMLLVGGGRAFRLVAGPVGALIGLTFVPLVATKFGINLSDYDARLPSAVAAVLAVVGFLAPPAISFLGIGLPLGVLAGTLAGPQDFLLGFIPTLLIGGLVAAILHRVVSSIVSSTVGAWLFVIGALAALHQFGGLVAAVANQPWGVIIAAGLFALAGSVYQIAVRPSPEEMDRIRAEKERLKLRKAEQRALEKRWGVK
ncbi:hypothetical protein [Hyalangium minutum]|uniref:Uncharacterized protein n=1 Tax=Hyalangium minutum TaxID=394096 RepID=A0A085W5H8_9BACT|nr:hypothetical protein [Hyalangium minutum]KFE62941.1 hypothetical protein DB31_3000 [Hyalangium minutum]